MSRRKHRVISLTAAVALLVTLAGCGMFGRNTDKGDRFVRPGTPRPSPSAAYTAYAENGPDQNGVATWIAVVRDSSGAEVFRDSYAYSTRHGVGITWLSTGDQLWLLSADVGDAHVDRGPDGAWTKTTITPETINDIPEEIRRLNE
jgi:hypothetical protein